MKNLIYSILITASLFSTAHANHDTAEKEKMLKALNKTLSNLETYYHDDLRRGIYHADLSNLCGQATKYGIRCTVIIEEIDQRPRQMKQKQTSGAI